MTITVDINVLLDVFLNRQPFAADSIRVIEMIALGKAIGICPAHGVTTLYYLIRKSGSKQGAEAALDHVLKHFQIGNLDAAGWQ